MSEMNIHIKGIINASFLLVKDIAENKAIPVIGVILGGCGNNLVNVANTIKPDESSQTINGDLNIGSDISMYASTGIITATSFYGDVANVTGMKVGIQSAGTLIGTAQTINFIGAGNTVLDQGDGTLDVSISGSGGGGLGTAINYADGTSSPFSYIDPEATVGEDMLLDDSSAGESDTYIVSVIPTINIGAGIAVTVGSGKTMVIDVLQIGDL